MKLYNINNVEKFFEVIDSCKGKVELVTSEGDRLNLKSQLCKFVAFNQLLGATTEIKDIEIVAYDAEDTQKLIAYMMTNEA